MSLSAREVALVAAEVSQALAGRPLQKVVQPDEETVLLGLKGGWLLLSAHAALGRLHLLPGKPPGTGEAAPAFCMRLRKQLLGGRLRAVHAVEGERACELVFDGGRLRLFLFGRASQLQLADEAGAPLSAIGPARVLHPSLPPPRPDTSTSRFQPPDLSAQIAACYAEAAARAAADREARRVQGELKRLDRLRANLLADRARAEAASSKRKLGDLLLAHLREVPRGASEVTLPDDFEGGAPITIPLDPGKSARDNAERFYKEHKRLSRALAQIDARLAAVDEQRSAVASGAFVPPERGQAPRRREAARQAPPYREYRSQSGVPILVGRGADRNDELTFKVGRGGDLWLHTRDVPGAHVIVPLAGRPVDEQTLLDAATLAAHHSNARDEAQVDVGYTLRKHVRKPPKAPPGTVLTSGLKTIRVRLEPERLRRLLATLRA